MKTIAVIISGVPEDRSLKELQIQPGATAGDVLRSLGLQQYLLSREGSAQAFAAEEEIYEVIPDGGKLRATAIAEVGNGVDWLMQLLFGTTAQPRSNVQPPRAVPRLTSSRVVTADRRPLWEVRGWRPKGHALVGAFRTPYGSLAGEILQHTRPPEFYVVNPPAGLLNGAHGTCFRPRGNHRYFVHFSRPSATIDAGLVAVEKLLVEALRSSRHGD